MRLGNSLLTQAKLDARLRELVILRIAKLCNSRYEWYQHEIMARQVGVLVQQIAALRLDQDRSVFNDQERAILRYTEEVTANVKSSAEAFEELSQFLSHQELVELTLTIGLKRGKQLMVTTIEVLDNLANVVAIGIVTYMAKPIALNK